MEEMDGISLAKELKRRNRKIALFFVTNYDDYQDSRHGFASPALLLETL